MADRKTTSSSQRTEKNSPEWSDIDPAVTALVNDIMARVADKWTLLVLEALDENGVVRFKELSRLVEGISQKMLTQTLRQMECDGLVTRTIYPEVPPRVEYELTPLGSSLGEAFCGVWKWAETHCAEIKAARKRFAAKHDS